MEYCENLFKLFMRKYMNKNLLLSNFSYMFAIEIANYILPFIAIPYIVRTVGVTNFGLVTFSYVVIAYFNLIVDYGFKMIIIKDISKFRNSNKKLSFLFWKMYISQFLLLIISIILFLILLQIPQFKENTSIFVFAFGMVIGNILFPIWFFQGIEKMKYIAIFDFIARLFYLFAIFTFIKTQEDYIYIPLLNSLAFIITGLLSLIYIFYKFKLQFIFPKKRQIIIFFKDGWHLFLSSLAVNLYSNFNQLLLGFFAGYTSVGIYSLADKIFGAVLKVIGVVNVVLYPALAKISSNRELLKVKFKHLIKYYSMALVIIASILIMLSSLIIRLLFGEGHSRSIFILQILAIVLLFRPFGQLFTNYLIINKKNKIISKITFQTMLFNIIFALPLIYFYKEIGLAFTILLVQVYQVFLNIKHTKELFK